MTCDNYLKKHAKYLQDVHTEKYTIPANKYDLNQVNITMYFSVCLKLKAIELTINKINSANIIRLYVITVNERMDYEKFHMSIMIHIEEI